MRSFRCQSQGQIRKFKIKDFNFETFLSFVLATSQIARLSDRSVVISDFKDFCNINCHRLVSCMSITFLSNMHEQLTNLLHAVECLSFWCV